MTAALTSHVSVRVPRRTFALWWLSLLLLHLISGVFFGASACFYWHLKGTYFDSCLMYYGVTMEARWYSTIAILLGAVALPHALAIIKMISASLCYRSFTFTFGSSIKRGTGLKVAREQHRDRTTNPVSFRLTSPVWSTKLYHFLCDRKGVFGVEGKHFHTILFCRELVETSLQTNQAYRMSIYLSRGWLNRFYVAMLVLNCWLTPLIHHLYKKNEVKKRLLCLVCDCALDLVASVVIPITILATYYASYVSTGSLVDMFGSYDEAVFMQAVNELQMLFVVSWRDLGTRLVFSLGLIIATSDVKELLVGVYITNQVNPLSAIVPSATATSRVDPGPSFEKLLAANVDSVAPERMSRPQHVQVAPEELATSEKRSHLVSALIHGSFFVWGAVVLGLHVYAESHVDLIQCPFQVRPWGKTTHVCSLVFLNCYSLGISGAEEEVDAQWRIVDFEATEHIQIRHCEALEMPPALQKFSQLLSIKLYNTTVITWNNDAAITSTHHPHLTTLFFVRVNMTDGELPSGLLSPDFPATVTDIDFSVTNLRSLPSDLDRKWSGTTALYFEHGAFTAVPDVVLRMKPIFLSFYGNPIRELPSELFESESVMFLHIGDSLVTSLPTNVTFDSNTSSLWYLYVSSTQLSYFPAWVDGMVNAALVNNRIPLFAADTPYCLQLEQIQAGSASEFVVAQSDQPIPLSVLMDASPDYLDVLQKSVSCSMNDAAAFFPLALEDQKNMLVV